MDVISQTKLTKKNLRKYFLHILYVFINYKSISIIEKLSFLTTRIIVPFFVFINWRFCQNYTRTKIYFIDINQNNRSVLVDFTLF